MSELVGTFLTGKPSADSGGLAAVASVPVVLSAGGLLRQAREAAGLHIAALAVSLKVPVKKLEALESDQFELLPDAVFVRALASSVCRTLKIDPAPVLDRLPQTSKPRLTHQGVGINTPFRAPGDGPGPSIWAQISRPAVLGGIVLLLGALVLIFLPALKTGVDEVKFSGAESEKLPTTLGTPAGSSEPAKPDTVNLDNASLAEASRTATTQLEAISSNPVAKSSLTLAQVPPAQGAVPIAPPVPPVAIVATPQAVALPTLVAASAALKPSSAGIVVFSARSESWVEVTDAKGQVVLRRTLGAGEVAGATGVLPLAAVVGRADATQVQVRGKAFDMSAFAKDNVARFEVK
ncbi:MAG: DUF4115 domain-containing protein [Polaromonas sp.]|nr:DUF4115 domain-containing protein [Polaromonas sp.]